MKNYHNKDGTLNFYAFSCGYVERANDVTLSFNDGIYFIKGFDIKGRHVYETARTVKDARKIFNRYK